MAKLERKQNEAVAILNRVRISPSKLSLTAALIRRMPVQEALVQLKFSSKAIAKEVFKCLSSAIANADYNHGLDVDKLVVSEVLVGKSLVMKRFRARARGRGARILKPYSNLTIKVTEV